METSPVWGSRGPARLASTQIWRETDVRCKGRRKREAREWKRHSANLVRFEWTRRGKGEHGTGSTTLRWKGPVARRYRRGRVQKGAKDAQKNLGRADNKGWNWTREKSSARGVYGSFI